ncbi:MAG: putative Ig domain-containing protein [Sulfuritalea sp.]|nr:putative Ig domain-containing protein [Sulfuritalea sp.]
MAFHQYRLNELYSNADGSIQFIELTVGSFNSESFWSGQSLTASQGGTTHSYTFPSNLPSTATANRSVLVATQGFADLGLVAPDFIVPAQFLFTNGGTVNFAGVSSITYASLPTDGSLSLIAGGTTGTNSPKNFAGVQGTVVPPPANSAPVVANALASQSATEDSLFSYTVPADSFSDLDAGDTLSYSATRTDGTALPTWLSFNAGARTFSGTPPDAAVGTVDVRVTATDGSNASVADDFSITVFAANDPPSGEVGLDGTARKDQTLSVSDTLADADGLGIRTYTWQASSDGVNWTDIGGGSSLVLGEAEVGKLVRVRADYTDGQGFGETVISDSSMPVQGHRAGTAANDIMAGTAYPDLLEGGDGNDVLDGGRGADQMEGGNGNDLYVVDHRFDQVTELADSGFDSVGARVSHVLTDHVENLFLTGSVTLRSGGFFGRKTTTLDLSIDGTGNASDNLLRGNRGHNQLDGLGGNDTLLGGAGADVLMGGMGADRLVGGTGADVFVFAAGDGGSTLATADLLYDFEDGIDRIALTGGLSFAGLTVTQGNGTDTATGNTVIRTGSEEYLVVLLSVSASTITALDFQMPGA